MDLFCEFYRIVIHPDIMSYLDLLDGPGAGVILQQGLPVTEWWGLLCGGAL